MFSYSGSIPAYAGKPNASTSMPSSLRVYPRIRGETKCARPQTRRQPGLSPHTRGNRPTPSPGSTYGGSIPAYAGKPHQGCFFDVVLGVYPRIRGETARPHRQAVLTEGLSPHTRGNRTRVVFLMSYWGSIPAYAGKPGTRPWQALADTVYPRIRGETGKVSSGILKSRGLSPHTRGNRTRVVFLMSYWGSIPAYAGKPPDPIARQYLRRVYPRIRGETESCAGVVSAIAGLSPHTRGNRLPNGIPRPL